MLFRIGTAAVGLYMTLTFVTASEPAACIACRESGACTGDDCYCCRDELTVPFNKASIPQIVYFSFDDSVTTSAAGYYRQLFDSSRKNPNGCPISMTLFVCDDVTNYTYVTEFYDKGMEIASHAVTHHPVNRSNFLEEASKQRENLATLASVPIEECRGFRSPYLKHLGDFQIDTLQQIGYSYDATLVYKWQSKPNGKPISPFTLDYGWPYLCGEKQCQHVKRNHSGFWEVPLNTLRHYSGNLSCAMADCILLGAPTDEATTFDYLWQNFLTYYRGTRMPLGHSMHYYFFNNQERLNGMDRFIRTLLTMEDVYIVSIKKTLDWLKSPTPLEELETFAPWTCESHSPRTVPLLHDRKLKFELSSSVIILSVHVIVSLVVLLICVKRFHVRLFPYKFRFK